MAKQKEISLPLGIDDAALGRSIRTMVGDLNKLTNAIDASKKRMRDLGASVPTGSITDLSRRLNEATNQLNRAVPGSKNYENALRRVDTITKQLDRSQDMVNKRLAQTPTQMGRMTSSTGTASYTLMNFNRVIQDSPYGIIGIANNIEMLGTSFMQLKTQTGSTKTALSAMLGSLIGPMGVMTAISLVTAGISYYALNTRGAKKDTDDFASSIEKLRSELDKASKEVLGRKEIELQLKLASAKLKAEKEILEAKRKQDEMRAAFPGSSIPIVDGQKLVSEETQKEIGFLRAQITLVRQYRDELGLIKQVDNEIGELREKQLKSNDPKEIANIETKIQELQKLSDTYKGINKTTGKEASKDLLEYYRLQYDLGLKSYEDYKSFLEKRITYLRQNLKTAKLEELQQYRELTAELETLMRKLSDMRAGNTKGPKGPVIGTASGAGFETSVGRWAGNRRDASTPDVKASVAGTSEKTNELIDGAELLGGTFRTVGDDIVDSMFGAKLSVQELGTEVGKLIAKMLLMKGISLALNAILPGSGMAVGAFKTGGIVGRTASFGLIHPDNFKGAKSFGSGGIARSPILPGNGVPIIAHLDEMVLTKKHQQNLLNILAHSGSFARFGNGNGQNITYVEVPGSLRADRNNFVIDYERQKSRVNNNIKTFSVGRG